MEIDPMEKMIADALTAAGISFVAEPENPTNLDFGLENGIQIEVKQFHSDRIASQMARADNVIAVQGREAVTFLADLIANARAAGPTPKWIAHEPVEGAVAPEGATTHWLRRDGRVGEAHLGLNWAANKHPEYEIIAYCTTDEPPATDADGYYKHDGSEIAPISADARVDRKFSDGSISTSMKITHWGHALRWRPVGEG